MFSAKEKQVDSALHLSFMPRRPRGIRNPDKWYKSAVAANEDSACDEVSRQSSSLEETWVEFMRSSDTPYMEPQVRFCDDDKGMAMPMPKILQSDKKWVGNVCKVDSNQFNLYLRSGDTSIAVVEANCARHPYTLRSTIVNCCNKLKNTTEGDHESWYNIAFDTQDGNSMTLGLSRNKDNFDSDGNQIVHVWVRLGKDNTWDLRKRAVDLLLNVCGYYSVFGNGLLKVPGLPLTYFQKGVRHVENILESHSELQPQAFSTVTTTTSASSDSHLEVPKMPSVYSHVQVCSENMSLPSVCSDSHVQVPKMPSGDSHVQASSENMSLPSASSDQWDLISRILPTEPMHQDEVYDQNNAPLYRVTFADDARNEYDADSQQSNSKTISENSFDVNRAVHELWGRGLRCATQ